MEKGGHKQLKEADKDTTFDVWVGTMSSVEKHRGRKE
jgi:hypothetical protein